MEEGSGGEVCYIPISEFVAALADLREVRSSSRWEEMARGAFRQLDYMGTGKLLLNRLVEELCLDKEDEDECKIELAMEVRSIAGNSGNLDDCEIGFEEFKQIISRDEMSNDLELYATRAPRSRKPGQAEPVLPEPKSTMVSASSASLRELLLQS